MMNPHLQLLLSRVYDGALRAQASRRPPHLGTHPETIAANLIGSVPPGMLPRLLGFDMADARSALLFPYRAPAGGFMDHARVKVFPPLRDREGHSIKYLQPRGAAPRVYFVTSCLARVLTSTEPLWLVEGEKKALAVAQLGLVAIGIAGVEGWHARGSHALLPDFASIPLASRLVEVLPDGDYQDNNHVRRAMDALGVALAARGARPRLVQLPRELSR